MGIKHATSKVHGDRGQASEWNADHVIDDDVNFDKHQALSLVIENRAEPPADPADGQLYYDTDDDIIKVWDGTAWMDAVQLREHDHTSASEGGVLNFIPIGAVIPWLKNFPGVPALTDNYVECNGQVLDDAESLLDGETIPDLNGDNRFVRGNATSGAEGGEETHVLTIAEMPSHNHQFPIHYFDGAGNYAAVANLNKRTDVTTTSTGSGNAHENRPPFHNVVWVIRIK